MNGNETVIGQAVVIADLAAQLDAARAELEAERQHNEALRAALHERQQPEPPAT